MKRLFSKFLNLFRKKPVPKLVKLQISTDFGKTWQTVKCGTDESLTTFSNMPDSRNIKVSEIEGLNFKANG